MVDEIVHLSHTYHLIKGLEKKQSQETGKESPKLEFCPQKKVKTDLEFSPPDLPRQE